MKNYWLNQTKFEPLPGSGLLGDTDLYYKLLLHEIFHERQLIYSGQTLKVSYTMEI